MKFLTSGFSETSVFCRNQTSVHIVCAAGFANHKCYEASPESPYNKYSLFMAL